MNQYQVGSRAQMLSQLPHTVHPLATDMDLGHTVVPLRVPATSDLGVCYGKQRALAISKGTKKMWLDIQLLLSSLILFIALSTQAVPGAGLGATAKKAVETQPLLKRSSELLGESLLPIETL